MYDWKSISTPEIINSLLRISGNMLNLTQNSKHVYPTMMNSKSFKLLANDCWYQMHVEGKPTFGNAAEPINQFRHARPTILPVAHSSLDNRLNSVVQMFLCDAIILKLQGCTCTGPPVANPVQGVPELTALCNTTSLSVWKLRMKQTLFYLLVEAY